MYDCTKMEDQVVLGNFSTNENKTFCDDDRNRRFYVEPFPNPDFDLTEGQDEYRRQLIKDGIPQDAMFVLRWMRDHREELAEAGILVTDEGKSTQRLNLDFVTRNCVLLALLRAAYIPKRYHMLVTLYRGTYYIEDYKPDKILLSRKNTPLKLFSTMKFIKMITSSDGHRDYSNQPVNANEMYFEIIKAKLDGEKLLYTADVHGERKDSRERPPRNYIIAKTIATAEPNRFKTLEWWSRGYLAGVPEIVCGHRDKDPETITSVTTYSIEDLATRFDWKPEVCLMKMKSLLQDIKGNVQDDNPRSVYHLYWEKVANGSGQSEGMC